MCLWMTTRFLSSCSHRLAAKDIDVPPEKKKRNNRTTNENLSPTKRKAKDEPMVTYKKRCLSGIHETVIVLKKPLLSPTKQVTDDDLGSSSGFLHLNQGHYCSLKPTIICDGLWTYGFERSGTGWVAYYSTMEGVILKGDAIACHASNPL